MESPGLRRIVLLRHAEAESHGGGPDRERRLIARGEAQAGRVGNALRGLQAVPDAIVSSPASRAAQTARLAAQAAGGRARIEENAALYEAGPAHILAALGRHALRPTVWVVGHNPGLQDAAILLGDLWGDWRLDKGCAAVLEVASWPLGPGAARLHRLLAP